MQYLDFEQPIQELQQKIAAIRDSADGQQDDKAEQLANLEKKLKEVKRDLYANLTVWQRIQVSRHPDRPYTNYYIENICDSFIELFGDRNFRDDKAIVGGLGTINGKTHMIIGHQKGYNTKTRQYRNFGMPNPEGYRKALRLMKLAEKFNKPIVTLIDTPGAYPGEEAEQRGQGEAIARNLFEMIRLKVPVLCIVIGEGASGGALGIGVGDRLLMMENTWYSVISPEACSSILWRTADFKEKAAEALKPTAPDLFRMNIIDGIIPEPEGGAHSNPKEAAATLKKAIVRHIGELEKIGAELRIQQRVQKYDAIGAYSTLKQDGVA